MYCTYTDNLDHEVALSMSHFLNTWSVLLYRNSREIWIQSHMKLESQSPLSALLSRNCSCRTNPRCSAWTLGRIFLVKTKSRHFTCRCHQSYLYTTNVYYHHYYYLYTNINHVAAYKLVSKIILLDYLNMVLPVQLTKRVSFHCPSDIHLTSCVLIPAWTW